MITYIKTAFTRPKEIYIGRNMKNSHLFYLILLVTLFMMGMSLVQLIPALNTVNQDLDEIRNAIPAFELTDSELDSPEGSFVYQTDSMIFYFDPDGKMEPAQLDESARKLNVPLSTGLLNDSLYINVLGQRRTIEYADIEDLEAEDLQTVISDFGDISPQIWILMAVIFLFVHLIIYLYQLLPIALFANAIALFRGTRLRLLQSVKMTVLASMIPFLAVSSINALIFPVSYSFEIIMIMSLFIFYSSITELKQRMSNHFE